MKRFLWHVLHLSPIAASLLALVVVAAVAGDAGPNQPRARREGWTYGNACKVNEDCGLQQRCKKWSAADEGKRCTLGCDSSRDCREGQICAEPRACEGQPGCERRCFLVREAPAE